MADVQEFGDIDDLDDLDLEPVEFVLRGWKPGKTGDKTPVKHKFTVSKMRPFSALNQYLYAVAANQNLIGYTQAMPFILASLVDDDERDRMAGLFDRREFYMDPVGLATAADWLSAMYMGRPTKQPSDSQSGPTPTPRRSSRSDGVRAGATSARSRRT